MEGAIYHYHDATDERIAGCAFAFLPGSLCFVGAFLPDAADRSLFSVDGYTLVIVAICSIFQPDEPCIIVWFLQIHERRTNQRMESDQEEYRLIWDRLFNI